MKTSRPIPGILLLAFTFFYAFAPSCGLVGHWVHRASVLLIGPAGSVVLAFTLFALGTLLVFPIGVWVAAARWFVGRVPANRATNTRARRGIAPIDVEVTVVPAHEKRAAQLDVALAAALKESRIPKLPTVERMKLSDVRTALKNLGYNKDEYESVMAGLDPALPLETLVRGAIVALRRN